MPLETRKMLALDADESAPKCRENAGILSHTKWIYFGGGEETQRETLLKESHAAQLANNKLIVAFED